MIFLYQSIITKKLNSIISNYDFRKDSSNYPDFIELSYILDKSNDKPDHDDKYIKKIISEKIKEIEYIKLVIKLKKLNYQ